MGKTSPTLSVAVCEQSAFIRISGRANFTSSVSFKVLVNELRERGYNCFVMDLTDCMTMDSTFLGVLAGFALKSPDGNSSRSHLALQLVNPNQRVADLLDNLGIAQLFQTIQGAPQCDNPYELPAPSETRATKEEISRTCLEAHETLMALNPANISKFKDVAQFLAEDLKKSSSDGSR